MKVTSEFEVTLYGDIQSYNQTLSKARCRIFYSGKNRNGTFIGDEFAQELISSLPYTPIKGIYQAEEEDYSDHGILRQEGRIYGIVPAEPNFAWETHTDVDGVERLYACADVLLFTALYKEANEIIGKSQSMELYEPSLVYHQAIIDGQKYIVFDHGCFLGLQVLGDEVEPCFEGASFFALRQSIEETIQKIKDYSAICQKGDQSTMVINFKLSDREKFDAIWNLINTEYNEEHDWAVHYSIQDIYDDYALAFNYENGGYVRVYYSKDDETNTISLGEIMPVFVIDVTENERNTVDTLRMLNGGTYECVNSVLENAELTATALEDSKAAFEQAEADHNAKVEEITSEFNSKIEELNGTISTLNTETDDLRNKFNAACDQNASLSNEINELQNFKLDIEKKQKEAVIAEYEDKLPNETIEEFRGKIDSYSVRDLDKELAYALKTSNFAAFNKETETSGYQYKGNLSGLDAILQKYVKD